MKKSLTIHDIARLANVSSATVSRVLSNSSYPVSAALRDKIMRIAKENNYIPNAFGKQLKTNTNMTLGVIIPTITNPFYSSVILGIEEVARKHQYQVLLCNSLQDPDLEHEYMKWIFEKQVKGLIVSSISSDHGTLQHMLKLGLHIIALDQKIDEEGVSQIEFDYRKGGYMATSHLIGKGHKRIAYVTAPLDRPSRKSILGGYEEAMREAGLKSLAQVSEREEVYDGIYEFNNGKRLTRQLLTLPEPPTAIFACNDMTAFGVLNELTQAGVRVPQDVSVMGFDGIEFGQMTTPALTTIKQPDYEMGRMACNMLLERLADGGKPAYNITLQPQLLERGSVGGIGDNETI